MSGTGVLYLGDVVTLPSLLGLYPYNQGAPVPRAEITHLGAAVVGLRWLDAVPRGHQRVEYLPYGAVRDAAAVPGDLSEVEQVPLAFDSDSSGDKH